MTAEVSTLSIGRIGRLGAALACTIFTSACTGFGSASIIEERLGFNEAVNYTSAEQTLANIVRVHEGENPTFVNVGDITSNKNFTANLTGGSSTIGALLSVGSLNSMVSANDQPIIKYVPTAGYELIRQVSSPILLNDIYRLNNSNAPLIPLLVVSTNRLTPRLPDYFRAIALINALDLLGALYIEQRGLDFLSIRFTPESRVRKVATGNKFDSGISCFGNLKTDELAKSLWKQLSSIFRQSSTKEIILNGGYANSNHAPVLTRTAQGALGLSLDGHDIAFLPKEQVDKVIGENERQGACLQDFYFLDGNVEIGEAWRTYYRELGVEKVNESQQYTFRDIAQQRSLILIAVSDGPLSDAFVSYRHGNRWFSIRDTDLISKRNFSLLSTISIIQAVPAAASTPTVNSIPLR